MFKFTVSGSTMAWPSWFSQFRPASVFDVLPLKYQDVFPHAKAGSRRVSRYQKSPRVS